MDKIIWPHEMLGFGDIECCARARDAGYAIIHACKHPCHRNFVGYENTIDKNHPQYLSAQDVDQLYLNIIDPPVPLFQLKTFEIFFDFLDRELNKKPLVIHCNRGESRAPSLALLAMAKRLKTLPDESYESARAVFESLHPYKPGEGISRFLRENWDALGQRH